MSARSRCNPTSFSICLSSFQFQINSINRCDAGMWQCGGGNSCQKWDPAAQPDPVLFLPVAAAFPLFPSLPSHSLPLLSPGVSYASRMQQQTDVDGCVQSCTPNFYICKTEIMHYQIQRGKLISQCAYCTLKTQN